MKNKLLLITVISNEKEKNSQGANFLTCRLCQGYGSSQVLGLHLSKLLFLSLVFSIHTS